MNLQESNQIFLPRKQMNTHSIYSDLKTTLSVMVLTSLLFIHSPTWAVTGIQFTKSGADFNKALYEEEAIDIKVKVLGSVIKHRRYLNGGSWQFNPNWASLKLEFNAGNTSSEPDRIKRNRFNYRKTGGGSSTTYVYDERNYIVKTVDGYRWKDRKGRWIDYDATGDMVAYSNKNNLKVYLTRDTEGRIAKVEDNNHDTILSYVYYANGLLQTVTDYTGRNVSYEYDNISAEASINKQGEVKGARLTKVTDVLEKEWIYKYDRYGMVGERIDPSGESLVITNTQTSTSACESWVGGSWLFDNVKKAWLFSGSTCLKTVTFKQPVTLKNIVGSEHPPKNYSYYYNKSKQEWTLATHYEEGRMSASTFNKAGELIKKVENGRVVKSVYTQGNTYTTADENGNKTITRRDAFKNPIQVSYADGSKITRTYNTEYSLLTSVTDENGHITEYQYNSDGNLLKMSEAAGTSVEIVTEYSYNNLGQRTQVSYADGRTEKWTYGNKGNIATYTNGEGHTINYGNYDALGNTGTLTDARGNIAEYSYNAIGQITQTKTALGNISKYQYDDRGNLTQRTDASNHSTQITYDKRSRVTEISNALNELTQLKYNSRGLITQIKDGAGKISTTEYDKDGNRIKTTDGNNNVIEQDFGYLNLKPYKGLLNETKYPSYSTVYEYDKRNRQILKTDKTAGEASRASAYRYDSAGNLIQVTNPNGLSDESVYDAHNRLIQHQDQAQENTQYQYDTHHNLRAVINAKNASLRQYEYNHNNQLTKEIFADSAEYQRAYDNNGNITQQTDAKGQVTQYEYDADNRLITSRTFSDSSQTSDNANAEKTTTYTYDAVNNLISYNDGITEGQYSYDAANRVIEYSISYSSFTKTAKYSYYPNGKQKSYTNPDGQAISYGYDNNNQLQTISIPGQGSITVNENNWLVPKTITYPGGFKQNYQYDGYLRTQAIKTSQNNNGTTTSLFDYQYQYDTNDNITQRNVLTGSQTGISSYSYDTVDRLTQITLDSNTPINLDYDAVSNRISDSRDADSTSWQYDERDRLTQRGKLSYDYDENGSLVSITHADNGLQKSFVYNLDNRLVEVKDGDEQTLATYQYDPFGRRISKTSAGSTRYYFYSDQGLVAELDSSGEITTKYGYRPESTWGTNPFYIEQNGHVGYYQNDHLGTPQQIINASGQVIWAAHYDAFGKATVSSEVVVSNLRFPGQYFDVETNLHYNYSDTMIRRLGGILPVTLLGFVADLILMLMLRGIRLMLLIRLA